MICGLAAWFGQLCAVTGLSSTFVRSFEFSLCYKGSKPIIVWHAESELKSGSPDCFAIADTTYTNGERLQI
ncbi:hypothetical protein MTR_8g445370 [Medicago truncatula]|uniref:Secreted protein n=1 Tax=Medicago truncatula TaxID=3880 RepID=A0A072TPU3_MEDTR|nr:hypothetical protein MTR_8g445370 [Medicago truncatula]